MTHKGQYFLIPLIIIIIIKAGISFASAGYTKEVFTAFSAGPGFEFEEDVFFLVNYRIYRNPLGFRRFPDGGQSKRVFEAVYLVKVKDAKIEKTERIKDFYLSDSDIKYTRAKMIKGRLFLLIKKTGKGIFYHIDCSKKRIKAEEISSEKGFDGDFVEPVLDLAETKMIFKEQYRKLDIPASLDYVEKSRKQLIKDVVSLKGDFYYRADIIDTLTDSEVLELPDKMEAHEESLKKGRLEYSIYSEDTKEYISKRNRVMTKIINFLKLFLSFCLRFPSEWTEPEIRKGESLKAGSSLFKKLNGKTVFSRNLPMLFCIYYKYEIILITQFIGGKLSGETFLMVYNYW